MSERGFEDQDEEGAPFRPLATWLITAINVAVFLGMQAEGVSALLADAQALNAWGGADAIDIWNGEIWRLATAMFVHGAIWHLGLNMWVLLQVGRVLERVLGASRFLLLYLVSGLGGFSLSLLFHPGLSVGASGAIFGVVGGLFGLAVLSRGQPMSRMLFSALTPFVVVTLVVGFLVPFVDNSAHIGGLVIGFLLGYGLIRDVTLDAALKATGAGQVLPRSLQPHSGWGALATAAVAFLVVTAIALKPTFSPQYVTAMAWSALRSGDRAEAERLASRAAELAPEDAGVLVLHGRLKLEKEPAEAARFFAQALTALDPEDPEAAVARAIGLIGSRSHDEAAWVFDAPTTRGLCDAAIERMKGKPSPELANNCAWVLVKSPDPRVHDAERGLELAERAVELLMQEDLDDDGRRLLAAHALHTLAEARAQNGDYEEARVTMERVIVEGYSDAAFFMEERDRFARLAHEDQEVPSPAAAPTAPAPLRSGPDAGASGAP